MTTTDQETREQRRARIERALQRDFDGKMLALKARALATLVELADQGNEFAQQELRKRRVP